LFAAMKRYQNFLLPGLVAALLLVISPLALVPLTRLALGNPAAAQSASTFTNSTGQTIDQVKAQQAAADAAKQAAIAQQATDALLAKALAQAKAPVTDSVINELTLAVAQTGVDDLLLQIAAVCRSISAAPGTPILTRVRHDGAATIIERTLDAKASPAPVYGPAGLGAVLAHPLVATYGPAGALSALTTATSGLAKRDTNYLAAVARLNALLPNVVAAVTVEAQH
jgi:hypothetical protein